MNKKIAIISLIVFLTGVVCVYAYDGPTTHSALTEEAVRLYNLTNPGHQITEEQKEWIIEGSVLEDTPPRWINHFYDPINETGWTGANAGILPQALVAAFAKIGVSSENAVSAVDWLNNSSLQEKYRDFGGNRTWDSALSYYANGDEEEAYRTLGYALHLLEDMGVPEHSRDDTHAEPIAWLTGDTGSPYEKFASKWKRENISALSISREFSESGESLPAFGVPEDYLIYLAEYSNKYFFSRDTILDGRYQSPVFTREDNSLAYGRDEAGKEFPLASVETIRDGDGRIVKAYVLREREVYQPIFDAYFSRLSRQAVLGGAGFISLFQEKAPTARAISQGGTVSRGIVSLYGTTVKIFHAISELGSSLKEKTANMLSSAVVTVRGLFNNDGEAQVVLRNAPTGDGVLAGAKQSGKTTSVSGGASGVVNNAKQTSGASATAPSDSVNSKKTATGAPSSSQKYVSSPASSSIKNYSTIPSASSTQTSAQTSTSTATSSQSVSTSTSQAQQAGSGDGTSSAGTSGGVQITTPAEEADESSEQPEPILNLTVLISEVQVGGSEDAGDEFVELYNPNDEDAFLDGCSLQYLSGGSATFAQIKKKNFEENSAIHAHGYFLIARGLNGSGGDGYFGGVTPDLSHRSISMSGASQGGTVFLVRNHETITGADDPDIVDRVGYGDGESVFPETEHAPLPESGTSIERKAAENGVCIDDARGEFLGNGCDTGDNSYDFVVRTHPEPQSSASVYEPIDAVTDSGFYATYISDSLTIDFSWAPMYRAGGSSEQKNVIYSVFNHSADGNAILFHATSTYHLSLPILEIGRRYDFLLTAEDDAGIFGISTVSLDISGYLNTVYFYHDPRADDDSKYVIDLFYDSIPFIPPQFSVAAIGEPSWQGIVFYLNRMPDASNMTLTTSENFTPQNTSSVIAIDLGVPKLSTIFAVSPDFVGPFGGGLKQSSFLLPSEDNHLALSFVTGGDVRELAVGDYITMAYYDFSRVGGGTQDLALVAADHTKYYFSSSTPSQSEPAVPAISDFSFDESMLTLGFSWSSSTDLDSADSSLQYEFAFATSSAVSDFEWRSTGNALTTVITLEFGLTYLIAVRAVDDFGNTSESYTEEWEFPEGFAPLPRQMEHAVMVGYPTGAGQGFTMTRDAEVEAIILWVGNDGGQYCCAESIVELHLDDGGAPGALVATSSPVRIERSIDQQENIYHFDALSMEAGSKYWIVPMQTMFNRSRFYGINKDVYLGGFWSDNQNADLYFRFIERENNVSAY